ncbi:MAG: peptidase M61 [Ideonella sp.]|jgi:predicted metalloprotease with PDZ domain|nr:peptidase M61 [Ideonella sp.]
MPKTPAADLVEYRIDVADAAAHRFAVTMTVPRPPATLRLGLPVWIPGSYLVREFARHLGPIEALQGRRRVALEAIDKASWRAQCHGDAALVLRYDVYAFDASVRTAWLDDRRGFFNGTSLCLRVEGREHGEHRIVIGDLPAGWRVDTAMTAERVDRRGRGRYRAAGYDELVDHPFELGTGWRGRFEVGGVPHGLVVAGALPDFDAERLLADVQRACEAAVQFWHGPAAGRGRRRGDAALPFDRYLFLLNAVDEGYGGLEHRASTALIASRRDLPRRAAGPAGATEPPHAPTKPERSDGEVTLLGLFAHEYFHAWNVKRLRPRDFEPLDYARENYTRLLWFFEGFTSYYDDLLLLRAGLIDAPRYLKLLARTITGVLATPGRHRQSVAQASFDAWIRYYRPDENTPNSTVSYYAQGSLVALALDLTLRTRPGDGARGSLDDAMRGLWRTSGGGPIDESDIASALSTVAGRPMADTLAGWVHGVGDLPLQALLHRAGVRWHRGACSTAQRLGVRASESALTGVKITHVLAGGLAARMGLNAGDEWLAVAGWRLRRLDDLPRLLPSRGRARCLLVRDQRVVEVELPVREFAATDQDPASPVISLALEREPDAAALAVRRGWLGA